MEEIKNLTNKIINNSTVELCQLMKLIGIKKTACESEYLYGLADYLMQKERRNVK